jgi:hypothetical protein
MSRHPQASQSPALPGPDGTHREIRTPVPAKTLMWGSAALPLVLALGGCGDAILPLETDAARQYGFLVLLIYRRLHGRRSGLGRSRAGEVRRAR